jgi:hypothetical protein
LQEKIQPISGEQDMTKLLALLVAGAFASSLSFTAAAQTDADKAARKQARAEYKAAKKECEKLKGAEEKACEKDVKAKFSRQKADAKAARKSEKAPK